MIALAASRHSVGMGRNASLPLDASPRREDPRAQQEALFEAWLPVVLRWCTHLGGPKVNPEDAAHDVMITVLTRMHTLRDPSLLPAWIYGVTRRTLAWHRRMAWVRRWAPGATVEGEASGLGPEASVSASELGVRVREVLAELPPESREVLVLCELEERSDEAVAELLGIPSGTVKSRLRKARQRFAERAGARGLGPVTPAEES